MIKNLLTTALYCALICPHAAYPAVASGQQGDIPPGLMPASNHSRNHDQTCGNPKSHREWKWYREKSFLWLGKQSLVSTPCKIQNAVLMVDSFTDLRNPPGFGMVITFAEAQSLGGKITDSLIKGSYEDMMIYAAATP